MEYMCSVCGYIYDGEDFLKEPADYQCPLCDAGKDEFRPRKIENEVNAATNEYHKKVKKYTRIIFRHTPIHFNEKRK